MNNGTPIKRVRGLGSAHEGTHHWLLQRFTAIGNLVLVGWFAISLVMQPDFSFETMRDWLSGTIPAVATALLVISTFWHARLGLQVMIEDYVHTPGNKFAAIAALNLASFGGAALALFSIAQIARGGAA